MSDWIGWVVGFFTAAATPLISDYVKSTWIQKSKISATILGANFQNNAWEVRLSVRNDGSADDTVVSAVMWLNHEKDDMPIYAASEEEGQPWRFRNPIRIPAASLESMTLTFWTKFSNAPSRIELHLLSGNVVAMNTGKPPINIHFSDKDMLFVAASSKCPDKILKPRWFPAQKKSPGRSRDHGPEV